MHHLYYDGASRKDWDMVLASGFTKGFDHVPNWSIVAGHG